MTTKAKTETKYVLSAPADYFALSSESKVFGQGNALRELYLRLNATEENDKLIELVGYTQAFLSDIVTGMVMLHPRLRDQLHVLTTKCAVQASTNDDEKMWTPTYPVTGYITRERIVDQFCAFPAVVVPCVEVGINRQDLYAPKSYVALKVTDYFQLEVLAQLIKESQSLWFDFEEIFEVSPSSSSPLHENDKPAYYTCKYYVETLLAQFKDDKEAFEDFSLEFNLTSYGSIHGAVVAAVVLLCALYDLMDLGGKAKSAVKRNKLLLKMKQLCET